MKKYLLIIIVAVAFFAGSCQEDVYNISFPTEAADITINPQHPMKDSLEAIIHKYVAKGIPGVQVVVRNDDGWYITGGGYAHVETQTPVSSGMVGWYFSITKIYTASLIMKLKEMGLINLDAPISQYLPAEVAQGIQGSRKITVRMLLNHSSGIVNLTELPAFQLAQFNQPLRQPSVMERVEMVYGKPLLFAPGTDFSYANTNYLLLYLIIEHISGKTYSEFLQEAIIAPLELKHTYYDLSASQMSTLPFSDYYFDRYGNEQLENITQWNTALGNSCVAYGGIAGTAADAIRFMEAWVNGEVVSEASMQEMKTWTQGKASTQPDYGLGLEYYQYGTGSPQYGHEGDGIGCTTQVMYVPDNHTYLYINCNVGRQLFGPYLFKTTDMKNALCAYVAKRYNN